MIGLIVLGAFIVGTVLANLRVPQFVPAAIASWQLSPFLLIMLLTVFYILLGTVLEGFSMIVLTLPIVLPIVQAAGFDKVWFGIFLVLTIEMAQISPPVAFNLFVIQAITGDSQAYVARKVVPFFLIMIGFTAVITLFPAPRHLAAGRAVEPMNLFGRTPFLMARWPISCTRPTPPSSAPAPRAVRSACACWRSSIFRARPASIQARRASIRASPTPSPPRTSMRRSSWSAVPSCRRRCRPR